jgi:UDP-N-acetylglucosamine transferase subunit ALG13
MNARYEVLVIVGTDHHPFNRLITWVNEWLGQHPERSSGFFVQWGSATVRPVCAGAQIVATDELQLLLADARVVICHGGGGSIGDAWAAGLAPIVVPRMPQLGEHVDDHQIHFSAKLAELGRIRLAQSRVGLADLLNESIAEDRANGSQQPLLGSPHAAVEATVTSFRMLVEELVSRPRRRFPMLGGFRPSRPRSPHWIQPDVQVHESSPGPISGGEHELAPKR